jgi:hypothetical protein
MRIVQFSTALMAAGMLIAGPALAQTTTTEHKKPITTAQAKKQKSDGEGPSDGGFNVGPASGAHKQRTDGEGPSDGGFNTGPASRAVPK